MIAVLSMVIGIKTVYTAVQKTVAPLAITTPATYVKKKTLL